MPKPYREPASSFVLRQNRNNWAWSFGLPVLAVPHKGGESVTHRGEVE